jgi:hypothetical protein
MTRLGLGLVAAIAVTPAAAFAGDGPAEAIGNMFDASPTLTIVSLGVVGGVDLGLLMVATRDAIRGYGSDDAVYSIQTALAGLQSFGFLAAPSVFDVGDWSPAENLGLLLPAQLLASTLTVHGVWSLASDALEPSSRLLVSALVGGNLAFTSIGLGQLTRERWAPLELAIAEVCHTTLASAISIERLARTNGYDAEWGSLLGWSLFGLAHGVGSVLVETPGSRVSESTPDALPRTAWSPWVSPLRGGAMVGVGGSTE